MMWGYHDGWSWLWMGGLMLLFWVGVIALLTWAIRAYSETVQSRDLDLETLGRRPAAVEISQEDVEENRQLPRG